MSENVGRRFAPPYDVAFNPPRAAEQVRVAHILHRHEAELEDGRMHLTAWDPLSTKMVVTSNQILHQKLLRSTVSESSSAPGQNTPCQFPPEHMPQSIPDRPHPIPTDPPKTNVAGYELLRRNYPLIRVARTLIPIYRKFETLNNRILLYLQDEICEIEDLRKLDEADAQINAVMSDETGHILPTSRRCEAKKTFRDTL
jgi:hypothetical protein